METMSRRFDARLIPARPNLAFEKKLWEAGNARIAGLDEAGRGALAGPVCAGAVVFAQDSRVFSKLKGLRDSKEMRPKDREKWTRKIQDLADSYAVGSASAKEIDLWGIVPASRLAMQRALVAINDAPDHLLVDALTLFEVNIPQAKLIKGDQRSLSIAAASVLAKVHRDNEMQRLGKEYPGYGLGQHKGYGTKMHRENITKIGKSAIHRLSFKFKSV